jgi:hypothetical protein
MQILFVIVTVVKRTSGGPVRRGTALAAGVVIGIVHWLNLPAEIWSLGRLSLLTEMSGNIIYLGGKGGQCLGLTTLQSSCARCLETWKS